MKHVSQILPSALTVMLAQQTPAERPCTQTWARKFNFQTLNDPMLETMVDAAATFIEKAQTKRQPHWLSFCGPSGTGKTHLASAAFGCLKSAFSEHESLICGALKFTWPRLLPRLREGAYFLLDDIRDANLVFLDDFGTERPTEFALEKLYEIIESRSRKWTILTSNLSVQQIAERMDTRISSRLIRDGSQVVDVVAMDFNLR